MHVQRFDAPCRKDNIIKAASLDKIFGQGNTFLAVIFGFARRIPVFVEGLLLNAQSGIFASTSGACPMAVGQVCSFQHQFLQELEACVRQFEEKNCFTLGALFMHWVSSVRVV